MKYLLSTIIMSGLMTTSTLAGPEMDELKIFFETEFPGVQIDWETEDYHDGFEIYQNLKITDPDGQGTMTMDKFEVKSTSDGSKMYRGNNYELSSFLKSELTDIKVEQFVLLSNNKEFMNASREGFSYENITCENFQSPFRFQLKNAVFSDENQGNVSLSFVDLSGETDKKGPDCMLAMNYRLDDLEIITSNNINFIIGQAKASGYTSLDGLIPSGKEIDDLSSTFELTNVKISSVYEEGSDFVFGGLDSMTSYSSVLPKSLLKLHTSDLNSLLASVNSHTFESLEEGNQEFEGYEATLNEFSDSEFYTSVWNGFYELVFDSSFKINNLYINPALFQMSPIPINIDFMSHYENDYAQLFMDVDLEKTRGNLEFKLGFELPKMADLSVISNFKVELAEALPTNPQVLMMNLPIKFNGLNVRFRDHGLDSFMHKETGSDIITSLESMMAITPLRGQKSAMITDWVSSGLNGKSAEFSLTPKFPMPFTTMLPSLMGDWENMSNDFTVNSSLK